MARFLLLAVSALLWLSAVQARNPTSATVTPFVPSEPFKLRRHAAPFFDCVLVKSTDPAPGLLVFSWFGLFSVSRSPHSCTVFSLPFRCAVLRS